MPTWQTAQLRNSLPIEDNQFVQGSSVAEPSAITIAAPRQTLSMPEGVEHHMIADHELSQLANPTTSISGSVGFTSVGIAAGFVPTVSDVVSRYAQLPPDQNLWIDPQQLLGCAIFVAASILAVTCLLYFFIQTFKNRSLASRIRKRIKRPLPTT